MKTYNNFTNHKILLGFLLPILAFFISMNATFAYFTSSVELDKSTTQTGTITIKITDDTAWKVNSSSISASTKLIPGDTLTVEGKVENAGNTQFYAILQLKINVTKSGETTANTVANKYYTYSGTTLKEIVVKGDGSVTATAFIVDAPNANKTNTYTKAFSIPYTFDFYQFDNSYKNAKVNYYVYAHAIQTKNITNTTYATKMLMGEILPMDYQQVEYIQSTGTQWIDTVFVPNQDTRVVMDFQPTVASAAIIFGSRQYFENNSFMFNMGGSASSPNFVTSYASQATYTIKKVDTERHIVDKNKNELYLDNVKINTSFTYQNFTAPGPLNLFAGYSANITPAGGYFPCSIKLYSCQIYDNGELIRDFVPCFRTSDNVVGLYDKVNNMFYTNSGSDEFLMGSNVNESLMANYQLVEYIESTGTQYINSNFYPDSNTSIEMNVLSKTVNAGKNNFIFGVNSSADYSKRFSINLFFNINGTNFSVYPRYSTNAPSSGVKDLSFEQWYKFRVDGGKFYVDNELVASYGSTFEKNEYPLYINAYNNVGSVNENYIAETKIKSCKIWDNGVLVRDFVPCYRISDNEIGLFDKVNKVFYTNVGTGTFLKGANV